MKVLIIGGTRFVGPLVVDKLISNGHNITLFNRGRVKSEYQDNLRFIKGNRNDGFDIKDHFDAVIDTCAYNGLHTKQVINELNFDYYLNFGTVSSYKKADKFPLTESSGLGDWPLWGSYNKGKVECENILQESGIKYASIRPVYILGKNNYVDREHFIYSRIKDKKPLVLPGNGQAKVQFVFAQDVADSIVLLAEKRIQGAFNCCSDDIITLKDFVEEMGKIMQINPIIKFNPKADGEKFNINEFPFANETFYCTNDKLKKLGIKFTPLLQGLKEDYENYYTYCR
jgi:nucleoside-diphosphate-sugar epimerase